MKAPLKAVIALAAILVTSEASAVLTFQLGQEFSGGQAPGGPPPWLTISFTQNGPNHVTLTLSASGLTGSENVKDWYFNVNNPFVGNLTFTLESKVGTFDTPSIGQNLDGFSADGGGNYDIDFGFTAGGVASKVFGAGEQDTWDIFGTGLTENDFNLFAAPHGGNGIYTTAAHVQNTTGAGSGGSGFVAPVPEPSSMAFLVLGAGAAVCGCVLRNRRTRVL